MRIDDVDPDELDDAPHGRRRMWVLAALAAVVAVVGVAVFVTARGDDEPAAVSTVAPTDAPPVTDEQVPEIDVNGPDLNSFPDWGSDYVGPRLEVLFERVTDAGIRIVVQDSGEWGEVMFAEEDGFMTVPADGAVDLDAAIRAIVVQPAAGGGGGAPPTTVLEGWAPEPWCSPVGGYRVTMTFQNAVGVGNGQRHAAPREPVFATLHSAGYAEAHPFRVLVLQAPADVLGATATWEDGATDTAAVVNGWVALAAPGEPSGEFTLTLETANASTDVPWDELPRDGDEAWTEGCTPPPPELPPPGEQPDDPGAAEAEITQAFAMLWDTDIPFEDKGDLLLDDTTGVAEAIDQVMDGGFGDAAASAVHTITEMVFVSPDEAWFRYDIATTAGNFNDRFGIAYRIDGVWKITRAVICQDLSLAGGQCIPFSNSIQPPAG